MFLGSSFWHIQNHIKSIQPPGGGWVDVFTRQNILVHFHYPKSTSSFSLEGIYKMDKGIYQDLQKGRVFK